MLFNYFNTAYILNAIFSELADKPKCSWRVVIRKGRMRERQLLT